MPRLKALHKNYMEARLGKMLKGYMASTGVTQKQIAAELDESQQSVSKKLATGKMSAKDMIVILQTCGIGSNELERIMKL